MSQRNVGDSVRAWCMESVHARFGGEGLVLLGNQDLASYPTSECGKAAYMGKENKECSYQMTYEEHVICDHPKKSLVCFVIKCHYAIHNGWQHDKQLRR